ncbi:hypothetical protein [Roseovarius litoreus]|uniref:hypothetical protein n=1 Tax=Roseovarius litoreus TaxID=1155722 RepID=UPI00165F3B70|nr:hypothetical protein [Roseovarius litoreus]
MPVSPVRQYHPLVIVTDNGHGHLKVIVEITARPEPIKHERNDQLLRALAC